MNIIFDMDGTLVDSAIIIKKAFEIACPKYNLEIPSNKTIKHAIGYANPFFYYKIYPKAEKSLIEKFGQEVEILESKIIALISDTILFEGIRELLCILKDERHNLYLASTGDHLHVETCLNHDEIKSYFAEVHCNEPDKEFMVRRIKENDPYGSWLLVGDKNKDSSTAKFNNIYAVGAGYGYCDEKDYNKFDEIINKPVDLLNIIRRKF